MLFRPDGPSRTPQMIYPNMGGRLTIVQIQPQGRDIITTDTKSCRCTLKAQLLRHHRSFTGEAGVYRCLQVFDLDEMMVCSRHCGVSWFCQDILVVLRVNEHAQPQVVLHLLLLGLVLPFPSILLILLHSQHRLHVDSFHLRDRFSGDSSTVKHW